jgi:hypothetical protein
MKTRVLFGIVALLVASLVSAGYAARDTHTMKHWHPMLIEPALGYFGLSFFGHDHTRHPDKVEDGAFVRAPVTSCWNYDFLERDCDGPDHYKAFVEDGIAPDSKIGAYMGDGAGALSPPRPKRAPSTPTPTISTVCRTTSTMGRSCGERRDATWRGTRWLSAAPVLVWNTPVGVKTLE